MDDGMGRGEMIRRLDAVARDVHDGLRLGPLSDEERNRLLETLARLLPLVADELQDVEDAHAAAMLLSSARATRATRRTARVPGRVEPREDVPGDPVVQARRRFSRDRHAGEAHGGNPSPLDAAVDRTDAAAS